MGSPLSVVSQVSALMVMDTSCSSSAPVAETARVAWTWQGVFAFNAAWQRDECCEGVEEEVKSQRPVRLQLGTPNSKRAVHGSASGVVVRLLVSSSLHQHMTITATSCFCLLRQKHHTVHVLWSLPLLLHLHLLPTPWNSLSRHMHLHSVDDSRSPPRLIIIR